jgi:hypothetical protein
MQQQFEAGLLARLAHGGDTGSTMVIIWRIGGPIFRIDMTARKDPGTAGEAEPGMAAQQQNLQPVDAIAQWHHGGGMLGGDHRGASCRAQWRLPVGNGMILPCSGGTMVGAAFR